MSESLQTCSITRSSWSSSFCSPDYDETHTHKIRTIKKISNFSVLNCHPFSVLSQLFFLLGLSFSLPLFFLTEFIFCGHLQSILIFPFLDFSAPSPLLSCLCFYILTSHYFGIQIELKLVLH